MTPHLVLFFDVNKTVIMHDPVQGKALPHILNDLLTEEARGTVDADSAWVWDGGRIAMDTGSNSNSSSNSHSSAEMSYGAFLRAKFPMAKDPAVANANKLQRKLHRQDFTSPGHPGVGLMGVHEELLQRLRLPAHPAPPDPGALAAAGLEESPYHFILPAFFHLIQELDERGISFNLVFRTFGDDLHRIAQEFNAFCEGRHPFFRPRGRLLDGSDGGVDRRLHLIPSPHPRFGTFFRSDSTTALVLGTFQQPPSPSSSPRAFYASEPGVEILEGLETIHEFLTCRWRVSQATLALRDFYPYWFAQAEAAEAGKLLPVDRAARDVLGVFFDDNILRDEPHIVDVRSVPDGTTVPWAESRERFLFRVEPLEAIHDERYFVRRLEMALHIWRSDANGNDPCRS